MDQTLMHRIRERAYHIWMETGGNPYQNWLQAETEILQVAASQTPRINRPKSRLARQAATGKQLWWSAD
jgi:Protein of unknown function (DUF2934)